MPPLRHGDEVVADAHLLAAERRRPWSARRRRSRPRARCVPGIAVGAVVVRASRSAVHIAPFGRPASAALGTLAAGWRQMRLGHSRLGDVTIATGRRWRPRRRRVGVAGATDVLVLAAAAQPQSHHTQRHQRSSHERDCRAWGMSREANLMRTPCVRGGKPRAAACRGYSRAQKGRAMLPTCLCLSSTR